MTVARRRPSLAPGSRRRTPSSASAAGPTSSPASSRASRRCPGSRSSRPTRSASSSTTTAPPPPPRRRSSCRPAPSPETSPRSRTTASCRSATTRSPPAPATPKPPPPSPAGCTPPRSACPPTAHDLAALVRTVSVVGIGAGNPEHITVQAIRTLNAADVVFMTDKGDAARELLEFRREVCARYVGNPSCRIVTAADPERPHGPAAGGPAVADWLTRRAEIFEQLIAGQLSADGHGAFLAWGDPAIYDGTVDVLG